MASYPFTVYTVSKTWTYAEFRIEGAQLSCAKCGQECGHKGSTKIENKSVCRNQVEELTVIGAGNDCYFVLENNEDYTGNESIADVPMNHCFHTRELAEAEVKRVNEVEVNTNG